MKRVFILMFVCGLMVSCAATRMSTISDPSRPNKTYKKILIFAPFPDFESRLNAENSFIANLAQNKVRGVSSLQVLPPTREYSDQEIADKIIEIQADAALFLSVTDSWTSQSYVPQTSTTSGTATQYGNSVNYRTKTQYSGGYYVSKPRLSFEVKLFDTETGNVVWMSTATTKGNAFARFNTMINSMAKTTVKKMLLNGVIAK